MAPQMTGISVKADGAASVGGAKLRYGEAYDLNRALEEYKRVKKSNRA
jgi:hypothetical protein